MSNSCWERRKMVEAARRNDWWKIAIVAVIAIEILGGASRLAIE